MGPHLRVAILLLGGVAVALGASFICSSLHGSSSLSRATAAACGAPAPIRPIGPFASSQLCQTLVTYIRSTYMKHLTCNPLEIVDLHTGASKHQPQQPARILTRLITTHIPNKTWRHMTSLEHSLGNVCTWEHMLVTYADKMAATRLSVSAIRGCGRSRNFIALKPRKNTKS